MDFSKPEPRSWICADMVEVGARLTSGSWPSFQGGGATAAPNTPPSSRIGHALIATTMNTFRHAIPGLREEAAEGIDATPRKAFPRVLVTNRWQYRESALIPAR
jgi:hypothetical protein